jgi:hypothetical protein
MSKQMKLIFREMQIGYMHEKKLRLSEEKSHLDFEQFSSLCEAQLHRILCKHF